MTTQKGTRVAGVACRFVGSHFGWFGLQVTVIVGWSLSLYSGLTTTGLCASLTSRGYGGAGLGGLY